MTTDRGCVDGGQHCNGADWKAFYASAFHKISTGCNAVFLVPSFIWCLQDVPDAAMMVSSEKLRTAGNNTSSPHFLRHFIMFRFVTKSTGHSATARRDKLHLVVFRDTQHDIAVML